MNEKWDLLEATVRGQAEEINQLKDKVLKQKTQLQEANIKITHLLRTRQRDKDHNWNSLPIIKSKVSYRNEKLDTFLYKSIKSGNSSNRHIRTRRKSYKLSVSGQGRTIM